jgi:hypothetical protein
MRTFMVGEDLSALRARSQNELVQYSMGKLRAAFGSDILDPTHVSVSDWAGEILARSTYSFVPVGTPLHGGTAALGELVAQMLFLAGEATIDGRSGGRTHGAFLSGIRDDANTLGRPHVAERAWAADCASSIAVPGRSTASQGNRGGVN